MAITYQTEGIKMPDIKKRETTEWIKAVAATYELSLIHIYKVFQRFSPGSSSSQWFFCRTFSLHTDLTSGSESPFLLRSMRIIAPYTTSAPRP